MTIDCHWRFPSVALSVVAYFVVLECDLGILLSHIDLEATFHVARSFPAFPPQGTAGVTVVCALPQDSCSGVFFSDSASGVSSVVVPKSLIIIIILHIIDRTPFHLRAVSLVFLQRLDGVFTACT